MIPRPTIVWPAACAPAPAPPMSSNSRGKRTGPVIKKWGRQYIIDFSKCSLCGLCVDVCPEQTLKFSSEYELVFYQRWDTVIDIMQRLEERP